MLAAPPRGDLARPMHCPSCHHENPGDHRFCGQCGSPLSLLCASCGFSNPPAQKFCGQCGARLGTANGKPSPVSPKSYTLGRILARQGQTDGKDAREELSAGLRLARQVDMRPLEAQCLLELGSLPTVTLEERREHLAMATRMLGEMGMSFWLEKAQQARTQLQDEERR